MGIIGGADGPTQIIVSTDFVLYAVAMLAAAILAAGVILFFAGKRKK